MPAATEGSEGLVLKHLSSEGNWGRKLFPKVNINTTIIQINGKMMYQCKKICPLIQSREKEQVLLEDEPPINGCLPSPCSPTVHQSPGQIPSASG